MKIAVAGGSGRVGRYVVEAAGRAGHDVTVLSRSTGVDLLSGVGLQAALANVEVIIDTINTSSTSRAKATTFFTEATRYLQTAGAALRVDRGSPCRSWVWNAHAATVTTRRNSNTRRLREAARSRSQSCVQPSSTSSRPRSLRAPRWDLSL